MISGSDQLTENPAAAAVLAALKDGKWRKARDLAKPLCKQNKVLFLPLLIEANAGLYRDMMSRGLTTDAATVLIYLRTIAPPELIQELEKLANTPPAAASSSAAAKQPVFSLAAHWNAVLEAAAAGESSLSAEALQSVDLVATSPDAEPPPAGHPAHAGVIQEWVAVRNAIDATGEGNWDAARDALRKIPAHSVFRHWRMYLRGARHWFAGEFSSAARCFQDLPPSGACAKAAWVVAGGKQAPAGTTPPDFVIQAAWWLAATGNEEKHAPAIAEAGCAWKIGKWRRAFDVLRPLMGDYWRSGKGELEGLMAAQLFSAAIPHNRLEQKMFDQCHDFTGLYIDSSRAPTALDYHILRRHLLLPIPEGVRGGEIREFLNRLLKDLDLMLGPDPLRDSVALTWLGEILAEEDPDLSFSAMMFRNFRHRGNTMRDDKGAQAALEDALKLDPANETAAELLLHVLEKCGRKSDRNRLLDRLVTNFPGNKNFVRTAGVEAAARKAYSKAAEYLRTALALDPVDQETRFHLSRTLSNIIGQNEKKGAPSRNETLWDELYLLAFDRPAANLYHLARWIINLRRSYSSTGDEEAELYYNKAVAGAPSRRQFLIFEDLCSHLHEVSRRAGWNADFKALPVPGWPELVELLTAVWHFADQDPEIMLEINRHANGHLQSSAESTIRAGAVKSDPAGAMEFVLLLDACMGETPEQHRMSGAHVLEEIFYSIREKIPKHATLSARDDLKTSMLKIAMFLALGLDRQILAKRTLIEKIMEEAGREGHSRFVQAVAHHLHALDHEKERPFNPFNDHGDDVYFRDDEEDDSDLNDFFDISFPNKKKKPAKSGPAPDPRQINLFDMLPPEDR